VTTGAPLSSPVPEIENSSITNPKLLLDWMSVSGVQNECPWYSTATEAELADPRLQPEDPADLPALGHGLRIPARTEDDQRSLAAVLRTLDPTLDASAELELGQELHQAGEAPISGGCARCAVVTRSCSSPTR